MTASGGGGIAEGIFELLRDSILRLDYLPGDKLSEARIAEKYGVSRSPVRAAFGMLQSEGYVFIKPQAGTFVARLTSKKIGEIMDLRALLETFAVRAATPKIPEDVLEPMRAEYRRIKSLTGDGRKDAISAADRKMHELIRAHCGNGEVERILQSYLSVTDWIRRVQEKTTGRSEPSGREMQEVLSAMLSRDPDGASEAMRRHIENIKSGIFQGGESPRGEGGA